jgi:F-type H+-transporting ATPase subunit gamma
MSLLKFRNRLKTVNSLHSIFAALQVVTVVRTKKVKEQYQGMERYLIPMQGVLKGRGSRVQGPGGNKVLVVITSNRGLCGNFNKAAVNVANKFLLANSEAEVVVLGKNGLNLLGKQGCQLALTDFAAVEKPVFRSAARLFRQIAALGDDIHVAYNAFKSTIVQEPRIVKLDDLPENVEPDDFILEPAGMISELHYHYRESRFFKLVLESQMGELGARFMVLKGAVDSSRDMSRDLKTAINKARQANITRELLEIVSAAEAVRSVYE